MPKNNRIPISFWTALDVQFIASSMKFQSLHLFLPIGICWRIWNEESEMYEDHSKYPTLSLGLFSFLQKAALHESQSLDSMDEKSLPQLRKYILDLVNTFLEQVGELGGHMKMKNGLADRFPDIQIEWHRRLTTVLSDVGLECDNADIQRSRSSAPTDLSLLPEASSVVLDNFFQIDSVQKLRSLPSESRRMEYQDSVQDMMEYSSPVPSWLDAVSPVRLFSVLSLWFRF